MIYREQGHKTHGLRCVRHHPAGQDGLVHISQISNERVGSDVGDKLREGEVVKVKVCWKWTKQGRIRLSMKAPPGHWF